MMATFIAYTVTITLLSALAAHLLERWCVSLAKPSRQVWVACLLVAVVGPLAVMRGTSVPSGNPFPVTTSVAPDEIDPLVRESFSLTASSQPRASLEALDRLLGWAMARSIIGACRRSRHLYHPCSADSTECNPQHRVWNASAVNR